MYKTCLMWIGCFLFVILGVLSDHPMGCLKETRSHGQGGFSIAHYSLGRAMHTQGLATVVLPVQ